MQKNKLRVGLLLDGPELAAWAYRMIEIIGKGDYAEIALIVQNTISAEEQRPDLARSLPSKISPGQLGSAVIRKFLLAVERSLVGKPGELPNAFRTIDSTELLAGVEVVKVKPRQDQDCDFIEGAELASIQGHDIDVFVQLGFRKLQGDILRSARYGIWSCDHSDPRAGGPVGYWEVMESWPETVSAVTILTGDLDSASIAHRSFSATHPMSLADNKSNAQWKALHFIPRLLKVLYEEGEDAFLTRVKKENAHPQFHDRRPYRVPTNGELGVLLWKKLLQKVKRKWEDKLYFRQWFLLYDIRDGISTSLWRYKRITPPKDRFWADPFIVARDGKYYIFIEELVYTRGKGHLSVIVMNKDGRYEPPVPVLEAPYHLSYPFVFEFEGSFYLIPESWENRTVELYKCTAFPLKWEFQKTLKGDCWMADVTLFQWQDKWWMFANQIETQGASAWDELFLYYSDSPLSDKWIPHRRNPVVSDVRSARPAGRLFVRHGRLYRPSQNCSGHYGFGFNICEVTKLTESDYEEKIVAKVEPKWDKDVISTHTINYEDGLTIIDGQSRRRRTR
jgi:hypothetical protein